MDDLSGHWLSQFPDSFTSLVSLNISCLGSEVSTCALERLLARCPNLQSLRLNRAVPIEKLVNLIGRSPNLVELGTGTYTSEIQPDVLSDLSRAFVGCKQLKSLSGFWDAMPYYLPAVHPISSRLTSLNLSYATTESPHLIKLVSECPNLQRLWVCHQTCVLCFIYHVRCNTESYCNFLCSLISSKFNRCWITLKT